MCATSLKAKVMQNQKFKVMINFENLYFVAKYKVKHKIKCNTSMKSYDHT